MQIVAFQCTMQSSRPFHTTTDGWVDPSVPSFKQAWAWRIVHHGSIRPFRGVGGGRGSLFRRIHDVALGFEKLGGRVLGGVFPDEAGLWSELMV